jgi:hypothetical protein
MVAPTVKPTTPPSTGGIAMAGATAVAGFAKAYTASKQAEAQGYYQQAANLVQAQESMRMAGLQRGNSNRLSLIQSITRFKQTTSLDKMQRRMLLLELGLLQVVSRMVKVLLLAFKHRMF